MMIFSFLQEKMDRDLFLPLSRKKKNEHREFHCIAVLLMNSAITVIPDWGKLLNRAGQMGLRFQQRLWAKLLPPDDICTSVLSEVV